MRGPSGFTLILIGTGIAGLVGYVITWLVPRVIGVAEYAEYAVFWSSLYLIIGALAGVQQEVTRATSVTTDPREASGKRTIRFAAVISGSVLGIIALSALFWARFVFPSNPSGLIWPLAVGTAAYSIVAVVAGSLYGISEWRPIFALLTVDGLLRLVAVAITLALSGGVVALAWAVVAPFPLALLVLGPWVWKRLHGRTRMDVGYTHLSWNVARTIVAAGAMGLMVSGFPLLLGVTSPGTPSSVLGLLILAITLIRAPLIVIVMSLQNFVVVFLRDRIANFWPSFARIELLILVAGLVLAALGWVAGPLVFGVLFPGERTPDNWLVAVLVVSSTLVAGLSAAGAATLAWNAHSVYSGGWIVAALTTVAALLLPLELVPRAVVALVAGPAAGMVLYLIFFIRSRRLAVTAL